MRIDPCTCINSYSSRSSREKSMPALRTTLGAIVATAATNLGVASAFKLKDAAEYEVKRDLLEKSYPAFKSFKGLMHAGMVPAALVDVAPGCRNTGSPAVLVSTCDRGVEE